MKVQYGEEMANHSDPESCVAHREVSGEALTGETGRPAIEPRNQEIGAPTWLITTEGNTGHSVNRKLCSGAARSKTLSMSGSNLRRSWEISAVSGGSPPDGVEKVKSHNSAVYAVEKSDTPIVPEKPSNNGKPAEKAEGRGVTKGNAEEPPAGRTQSRETASMGLDGIRKAAQRDKALKFTALLHHITPIRLLESFYELKRKAAVGVDGVCWVEYESDVYARIPELHRKIQNGSYRAFPSRRVYIPKADGKLRPLGIAAIEDKIVQQAVVQVLNQIYEEDFMGFSYGFRKGRSQHDALDALHVGIEKRKINWIVDADIQTFFDTIDHEWMMRFLEHRIGDKRILRLIHKWLKAGAIEDGKRIETPRGCPQGAVISPLLANVYLHYVQDLWVNQWRQKIANGQVIIVRYADDSVAGFERREVAEQYLHDIKERLAKFGLALHPDKTRLIEFGRHARQNREKRGEGKPETFDFLGFTHCCGKTRQGKFKILRVTIKKRMCATLKAIRENLRKKMHEPISKVGKWLGSVIGGYFNYFAVPGNLYRMNSFRAEVCRAWRRMLNRRSQRGKLSWATFRKLDKLFIPKCRVMHPYPEVRFYVKYPR